MSTINYTKHTESKLGNIHTSGRLNSIRLYVMQHKESVITAACMAVGTIVFTIVAGIAASAQLISGSIASCTIIGALGGAGIGGLVADKINEKPDEK